MAGLLAIAGIAGYYLLSSASSFARVGVLFGGLLAAGVVAWFTMPGQQLAAFSRESVTETKKVAWPNRKESLQTTGAVFAFVVIMAVFLWVSDKSLEYLLYDLILGWKKS
jgi:preprotein translocase subunit SecE